MWYEYDNMMWCADAATFYEGVEIAIRVLSS
jgi:hypothetical protein